MSDGIRHSPGAARLLQALVDAGLPDGLLTSAAALCVALDQLRVRSSATGDGDAALDEFAAQLEQALS